MFLRKSTLLVGGLLAFSSLMLLNGCQDKQQLEPNTQESRAGARLASDFVFYALTDNNQLLMLYAKSPSTVVGTFGPNPRPITNLMDGERLIGIDFRPATGQLYGVSNRSRIYIINALTGRATAVGTTPFTPAIMGSDVGFDFNPTVDRIRLVSNTGQDLRLNPETGAVAAVDGTINGAAGASISGVAYTNSRSGATATTLYDIDPVTDKLYRQNPPNNGTLEEVGSLGVDAGGLTNFDIGPDGSAIASLIVNGVQSLYEIDLTTGQATLLGNLPSAMSIVGLAIPQSPIAYVVDGDNVLHYINNLGATTATKTITGLQPGETLYGIDLRPANGQLFGIGSTGRIYTINMSSGAATAVGAPIMPALTGSDVGFDFNPTVDRIRIVTSSGQNLRYNPNDNSVLVDGPLNPGTPVVTAAAYTNSFAGATSTTLYVLDTRTSGMLYVQNPPNNGTLVPMGPLNVSIEGGNGFDIGTGRTDIGYAMLRADRVDRLYTINLTTGLATEVAPLAGNPSSIRGFTVGLGF